MDLGEAKSIDMIELYGRKAGTNRDMDGNFKVYGSNDGTVTDFEAVPEGSATPAGQMPTAEFEALGYTAIADFSVSGHSLLQAAFGQLFRSLENPLAYAG